MKKLFISILSIITAACLALSVPACGNSGGSSTDDTPDNQIEQTGSNQNSTVPEGAVTYLARANELGSEVQNVPTPSELSELSSTSTSGTKTAAAKSAAKSGKTALASTYSYAEDYVDLSSPEDNANYQDYLSSDRLMWDTFHTFISYGDNYVELFKDLTKNALEGVVQFDSWVYVDSGKFYGKYRLSYDEITDLVTVEYLNGSSQYVYITSTYNDEGKSVISGYIITNDLTLAISSPVHIATLNYVEDDYWEVLSEYQSDELEWQAYNFLCSCNLSGESKEFLLYPGRSQVFLLKKSSPCFVDLRKELTSGFDSDTQEIVDCHRYYDYMYNSSAEKVGTWELIEIQNDFRLEFDIYELDGWDSFYYENETYYLTVNGETAVTGKDPFVYGNAQNYVTSQNGEYEYWIYISYSKDRIYMPALAININLLTEDATYYGAICDLLQNIGISPKDDIVYEQLAYIDTRAEVFTFDAFGLDGSESPSYELYQQISAQYKMQTISIEQISEYDNETYINEYEQTEDKQYYFIFQPEISGSVAFDSKNGEIDLSEISLTISAGILAVEGNEYAAIVIATDGTNVIELTRATAAYSGGNVTLSWTENITTDMLTEKLTSGEYTIKYYVARVSDENLLRVSEVTDISVQGSYVLIAEDYRLSITCGDAVKVVYEEYVNPNITGEITVSEDCIDISDVSVTISADQLAVERGEYAAVIAAENESGEFIELARVCVQFISNDITLSGFEVLSADEVKQLLPDGSYTLKLYIVRSADGEEIALSEIFTISADAFTVSGESETLIITAE